MSNYETTEIDGEEYLLVPMTEAKYESEIEDMTDMVVRVYREEDYDDIGYAFDIANEELDSHAWFTMGYGMVFYAALIQSVPDEVWDYLELGTYTDGQEDPAELLKTTAAVGVLYDVERRAMDRLED